MRFAILLSFILCGCLGSKHPRSLTTSVKTNFTNRLEGKNTGLSKKINISGIYRYWKRNEVGLPEKIHNTTDTFFVDMVFYEDGTFAWNLWISDGFSDYDTYFKSVISKGKKAMFYEGHYWGVYSIAGDTIKAQFLMYAWPFTPWYFVESYFLIKNPSTLQLIYFADIDKEKGPVPDDSYIKRASMVYFIPQKEIPPPLGWIKFESFFWRNEQDRQQFLKNTGPPPKR